MSAILSVQFLEREGLLTPEISLELQVWFKASCNSREPLELPEKLFQVLSQAWMLNELDEDLATMH